MATAKQPVQVNGIDHWACPSCKNTLSADSFSKGKSNPNGLRSHCKACDAKRDAKRNSNPVTMAARRARKRRHYRDNTARAKEVASAWKSKNRKRQAEYHAEWKKANSAACSANKVIKAALIHGEIVKPCSCEVCDSSKPLEGHHDSYDRDRWLTVTWMCIRCHRWHHARHRDQAKGIWL